MTAALVAAPARAADLPVPATPGYYPPVYSPALYDWTGIYFGGHVGADLLADNVTQSGPSAGPTNLDGPTAVSQVDVVGGGQIGANYELSHWIAGAEATWSATNLSASGKVLTSVPNTTRSTSAPTWFYTAAGRVGYAGNDLMLYVKGGGAWMRVGYTQDTLTSGQVSATQSLGDTRSGFVAGVGLEYGLTENFSAKFEYDFLDFGTKAYNFAVTPVGIRSDLHVLELGVNYRFNWAGGGPLVAKN
ncbi:MAG: outer membrane beta-barrel protein [Xanthobacteraceae bacterium]|jgi:outer membrane immunogenic protein